VPGQPVLAGPAGSDEIFLSRLFPAAAVAVFVLVRVVFGAAVAAARGVRPGGAAPAGVCGAAYPGGVHGAPAGAVRCAVAVACAAPVTKCKKNKNLPAGACFLVDTGWGGIV